jgi:hypothetical protein
MNLRHCLAILAVLVGCGDDEPTSQREASVDSGTVRNDAGVECCIPSPAPACCMGFGGAKSHRGTCGKVCDGMPGPSDPAWRLVNDAFGCPTWSSKGSTGRCCGSPPPPPDASTPHDFMCYPDPVETPG